MGDIEEITTEEELETVTRTCDVLLVISVYPSWSLPCAPLAIFAKSYPPSAIKFVSARLSDRLQVCGQLGAPLRETSEPTFVLMIRGYIVDVIHGLSGPVLRAALDKYLAMRAAALMTGSDLLSLLPMDIAKPRPRGRAGSMDDSRTHDGRRRRSSTVQENYRSTRRNSMEAVPRVVLDSSLI